MPVSQGLPRSSSASLSKLSFSVHLDADVPDKISGDYAFTSQEIVRAVLVKKQGFSSIGFPNPSSPSLLTVIDFRLRSSFCNAVTTRQTRSHMFLDGRRLILPVLDLLKLLEWSQSVI